MMSNLNIDVGLMSNVCKIVNLTSNFAALSSEAQHTLFSYGHREGQWVNALIAGDTLPKGV